MVNFNDGPSEAITLLLLGMYRLYENRRRYKLYWWVVLCIVLWHFVYGTFTCLTLYITKKLSGLATWKYNRWYYQTILSYPRMMFMWHKLQFSHTYRRGSEIACLTPLKEPYMVINHPHIWLLLLQLKTLAYKLSLKYVVLVLCRCWGSSFYFSQKKRELILHLFYTTI